jgi:hypothetical protein
MGQDCPHVSHDADGCRCAVVAEEGCGFLAEQLADLRPGDG